MINEITKQDLTTMDDIILMVNSFYEKVQQDELLAPVFGSAVKNWQHHLPVMYTFWGSMLLGAGSYRGNPFAKHIPLDIDRAHFANWIALFNQTVDEHFAGAKAEEAKQRAQSIAQIFSHKLELIKG